MKKYLDNIIFALQNSGGISVYWVELLKRFQKSNYACFYEIPNKNIFRKTLENLNSTEEIKLPACVLRYLPFMKTLPNRAVFHSSYYRVSLQLNVANITTVHDFTYEYFRTGFAKWIHHQQKAFAIKKSSGIICVSENTKNDVLKFFPKTTNIKVIYNGVGDEFRILNNPGRYLKEEFQELINKKYILYVGDRSSYKNFDIALSILEKEKGTYLVLIGGGDLKKHEQEKTYHLQNKIIHLKGIDSDKLNVIYNNAFCLLYPSSYEGFGIPILEAMKAGCPVISTNCSSIPEVAGDAALLVDKIEVDAFIEKIRTLENDGVRSALIEKGLKQAEKFSWDKCFEETYAFYEEVYKRKFGEIL